MKVLQYIILFALIIHNQSFGQYTLNDLQGDWVKYKTEMKDGSSIYTRSADDSSYIQFSFKGNNMSIVSEPVHSVRQPLTISFSFFNNEIKLNSNGSYFVEMIRNDTLIIVDNYADTPDKLKRYFMVNEQSIANKLISSGQKSFLANRYCKAKLSNRLNTESLPDIGFKIKGKIRIHLQEKIISVSIDSSNTIDSNLIKKITRILEKSFEEWDLVKFQNISFIDIPFFAMSVRMPNKKIKSFKKTIDFVVPPLNFYNEPDQTTLENMSLSTKFYTGGLVAFKKKEYDTAIGLFTKAFDADKYNIEALYSRAAVYYYTGKKDEACKDWLFLENLGQIRAKNELIKYCK